MTLTSINYGARLRVAFSCIGDGAFLILSPSMPHRSGSIGLPFRQESMLHYLTGFEEPESALLLVGHKTSPRSILFLREKDSVAELWEGRRLGIEAARTQLAVDEVRSIGSLWDSLPELLQENSKVYYHLGRDEGEDRRFIHALTHHRRKRGRHLSSLLPIFDTDEISSQLRIRKGPEEIERMRVAAQATAKAFANAFNFVRPGMNERDVYAHIIKDFLVGGAEMQAYGAIVAGGANACVLHYKQNSSPLCDGDLLLIDAGSQFQYYASDVTRTFPVGKGFSKAQRAIYDIVLDAQLKAIAMARPGSSLTKLHDTVVEVLTEGLIDLGLLRAGKTESIEKKLYFKYYPHGTSHWIGMDVHDVGAYMLEGAPRPLEPGMYFSVEPGIYVDPHDETAPVEFRGIGIRIEDDILISRDGCEVLTGMIHKEPTMMENRY